jgi:hypothetical protein
MGISSETLAEELWPGLRAAFEEIGVNNVAHYVRLPEYPGESLSNTEKLVVLETLGLQFLDDSRGTIVSGFPGVSGCKVYGTLEEIWRAACRCGLVR